MTLGGLSRTLPPSTVAPRRSRRSRGIVHGLLTGLLAFAACVPPDAEIDSTVRGDLAFAKGDFEEALAEYRLALTQAGGSDIDLMLRLAHTYAASGRADQAAREYERLVELRPSLSDQAVADLMRIATEAMESADTYAMARAVDAALKIRPGLGIGPPPLDLARHYYASGEYGMALPFYHMAIAGSTDSVPEIVFEVGRAHEEIGDCRNALAYFEQFREMVGSRERDEVDWFIGNCAFARAQEIAAEEGSDSDLEEALRLLDRVTEVGEPRNRLAEVWFEKGNLLSELKRCDAAMAAFAMVMELDPGGSLGSRARAAYDRVRFGGAGIADLIGRCH